MTVQRTKTATIQKHWDSPNRSSNIITEPRLSDHMILWWSGRSVTWLNLANGTFSMTVENFNESSHWKLLISDIRPRHTSTALAAHLWAAAHRLGSTALKTPRATTFKCWCYQSVNANLIQNLHSRLFDYVSLVSICPKCCIIVFR